MTEWNFATCWEAIADAQPDRLALAQGERHRTWGEWDDRSARLAAAFAELGLEHDGKVASYLYNSIEYLEGVFATWKCGGGAGQRELPVPRGRAALPARELRHRDPPVPRRRSASTSPRSWRDVPTLKAIVQVDDGQPARRGRAAVRGPDRGARARAAHRAVGRRPLHPLHRRHHRHAQGRDVAQRGPVRVARAVGARPLRRRRRPRRPADFGRVAAEVAAAGRTPVHLPASPLMHGTGFMSSLQALCAGGTIVTLESRSFDAHELWRAVGREHVTQMAIVGDAFGKPMVRALEDGRGRQRAVRPLVARPRHQLRRDVDRRGQAGADGTRRVPLPRLARLERGRRASRSRSARPGAEATTAKFSIGAHTKVLTEDGREVAARLRRARAARARRPDPARLLQGPREVGGHVPRPSAASGTRSPATGPRSRPTARSSCSAGAACRSTPAARRSSPKRSRRR